MSGKDSASGGRGVLLVNAGRGALRAVLLTVCVFLVLSLLMVKEYLPSGLMREYIIAAVFFSALAGGVHAARRQGRGVAVTGAVCGVLFFVPILLLGALNDAGQFGGYTLRLLLAAVVGGTVGGVLTARAKRPKKLRRKK
ncbi:MAG: TIGR04086 family membrane protein [Clostridiales bacterium]|nr:TIGR04086 family membrane protein [Clostridiales bacterium]